MTKAVLKAVRRGAARKSSPKYLKSDLKVGDRVRILDIPEDLKDSDFDRKDPHTPKLRTGELFRFCLGKTFTVYGFGRYGHVELQVGKNREVRGNFGWSDTIWIEPEFLKLVRRKPSSAGTRA